MIQHESLKSYDNFFKLVKKLSIMYANVVDFHSQIFMQIIMLMFVDICFSIGFVPNLWFLTYEMQSFYNHIENDFKIEISNLNRLT